MQGRGTTVRHDDQRSFAVLRCADTPAITPAVWRVLNTVTFRIYWQDRIAA